MDPREHFRRYIKQKGLKSTQQRDVIIDAFFSMKHHLSVDDLYTEIRKRNPAIGYATVYRTLKLLKECGLAREWNFGEGHARYEHVTDLEEHHDHMVCIGCGAIEEFENDRIEKLQDQVAREHGFTVVRHNMELYGYCRKCNKSAPHKSGAKAGD